MVSAMPRRRKPHHHEVRYLTYDPATPFADQLALYLRLSDDDPDSVSIEHQEERGTSWAKRNGKTIVAIYVDWRTGRDPNRLAMHQLCEDAREKRHSGVVFWDDTRLHRGVFGAYPIVHLHSALPKYTFTGTAKPYDIGKIGYHAQQGLDELENTRRRSMEERRVRAANGEWVSGMKPYWLSRDPETKEPRIDAERAAAFMHALLMYAAPTGSAAAACQWLTLNAPPAARRSAPRTWSNQRLVKALRNPALWGDLPYARGVDEVDHVDGIDIVRRRVENPEQVAFKVPPLIHKNRLERTECELAVGCERDLRPTGEDLEQLIRQRNGKHGGRPWSVSHPLRTIPLMCACGWRVRWTVQRSRGADSERVYLYVDCSKSMAKGRSLVNGEGCSMHAIPVGAQLPRAQGGGLKPKMQPLWPRVRAELIRLLQDPTALIEDQRQQVLAEQEVVARSVAEEANMLAEIDAKLEVLQQRQHRLYLDYSRDDIDQAHYRYEKAIIENERQSHEQRKRLLLTQRQIVQRADRAAEDLTHALARLSKIELDLLTDDQWMRLLPHLVEVVTLDLDGGFTIRWHRPS